MRISVTSLLGALAALTLAAPAPAAITPSRDANAVAGAITEQLPLGSFAGAAFTTIPPSQQPDTNPVAIADTALTGFPTSGSGYALLTTGNATFADAPNDSDRTGQGNEGGSGDPSHGALVFDLVTLRIDFNVPLGSSCLRLDVRFLSEEFPEFVGQTVNDAFVAELDQSTFTAAEDGTVTAPDNFAFDTNGNLISINTAEFSDAEAAGTTYDGATPRLRASSPITPGRHSLFLSVFDQGDQVYDSAAFVDAIRLEDAPGCVRGATSDTAAPAVTLTTPAPGSTVGPAPVLAGAAGDASGDAGDVTVQVFSGSQATGQPVQTLTVPRSGASWSAQGGPLAAGTYTARATQGDAAGNAGAATSTFTVVVPPTLTPTPEPTPLPRPVTGKSVNVEPVKGTVTVKAPNGRTVRLEEAEQIPTGSVIDTRRGTVRLFSTGTGGKIQSAIFFDGLFRVTQTRGSRPLTDLKLVEPLARCKASKPGGARASAKKKKRRLWGDGKGSFRTSGRRSAATVSGTKWLVEDSCAGTLTRVARGKVKVRDFKKRKTVVVRAGRSYRAR